jgi:hypothetical protein
MPLSKNQLVRLQTLYAQYARHEIGIGLSREERLAWASQRLRKPVTSFSDLSSADAGFLIDGLQESLGVKAPSKPRKRHDRDQARRAGKDGRHDGQEFSSAPQLASAADLAVIEDYYARLEWSRAQFDAWLRSPRSPLKHKAAPSITTLADANRVRWALKQMLVRAGKWEDRRPA